MLGWLIAPLAVMLAIAAIMVAGIDFDLDLNNTAPLLIVAFGAILGITPRVLKENGAVNFSSSALSLATLGAAMVGHQAIVHVSDYGAFTALQFLVVAFGVFFFDSRGRHEFATILTFGMIGINVGMIAAGSYNSELDTIYTMSDESLSRYIEPAKASTWLCLFQLSNNFCGAWFANCGTFQRCDKPSRR